MRPNIKKKKTNKSTLAFKIIIIATIIVALASAAFFVYFAAAYFNQKSLERKSIELPGLTLYSVQEVDYNSNYTYYLNYPKNDDPAFDNAVIQFVSNTKNGFLAKPSSSSSSVRSDLNVTYIVDYYNSHFLSVDIIATQILGTATVRDAKTILYDREAKHIITLDQLFKSGSDYLTKLSSLSRNALKTVLGKDYNQDTVNAGTQPNINNFSHFTVGRDRNLELRFAVGQVAPANIGTVTVSISGASIADMLTQPYANNLLTVAAKPLAPPLLPLTAPTTNNGPTPQASADGADCSKLKCVALTFDDGPSYTTPDLLATLKANNVKATFFELGIQVQKYPSITKQVVAEGHIVGNHTYDHKDLEVLSVDADRDEINKTADLIQNASGVRPGLVRAPYGSMTQTLAKTLGAPFISWNVDPNDWKDRNSDTIYNRVISAARPGAIILSHDIYQTTVDAYKRIIPELIKRGYTLVTVPQLLGFGPNTPAGIYFSR